MDQPKSNFSLPSWLRLKNETTPVQAALLSAPMLAAGLAAIGLYLWTRRGRHGGAHVPPGAGDWLQRVIAGAEVGTAGREVLAFVRDSVVGLDKRQVRRLLGAPSAAGEMGLIVAAPPPARQAVSDRWYYRLDEMAPPPARSPGAAFVVEFDGRDRARDAKFLLPPR